MTFSSLTMNPDNGYILPTSGLCIKDSGYERLLHMIYSDKKFVKNILNIFSDFRYIIILYTDVKLNVFQKF